MSLVAILVDSSSSDAVSSEMQQFLKSKDMIGKAGHHFDFDNRILHVYTANGDRLVNVYDANGDRVVTVSSKIELADLSEILSIAEHIQYAGYQRGLADKMLEISAVLGHKMRDIRTIIGLG